MTREAPPQDDEAENVILASIDRFLERDVKPYAQKLEHDDIYPEEIVERMKELGLFGATIGADYGGLGLSATTYAKIVETRLDGVDVAGRHLQLAPDHGGGGRALRHRRRRSRTSCRASRPANCAAASR